jgi:hypothetical protein
LHNSLGNRSLNRGEKERGGRADAEGGGGEGRKERKKKEKKRRKKNTSPV